MSKEKRKKHGYAEVLKYMHLIKSGRTFNSIRREYGVNEGRLKVLWERYQKMGPSGLRKMKNIKADFSLKKKIVVDIEENHLTLHGASLKYGASPSRISVWLKKYRTEGPASLSQTKRRGRLPIMGRHRKKRPEEMTELERLRYENECLKTENALLKKVKALVEEREARLKGIGREPSKD